MAHTGTGSPRCPQGVLWATSASARAESPWLSPPPPNYHCRLGHGDTSTSLCHLTFMWYIIISLAKWLRYCASFTFLYSSDCGVGGGLGQRRGWADPPCSLQPTQHIPVTHPSHCHLCLPLRNKDQRRVPATPVPLCWGQLWGSPCSPPHPPTPPVGGRHTHTAPAEVRT